MTTPNDVHVLGGLDAQGELSVELGVGACTVTLTRQEAMGLSLQLLWECGTKQNVLAQLHDLAQTIATLHDRSHREGLAPREEAMLHMALLEQARLERMLQEAGEPTD
jgi:hypothetical protein